MRSLGKLSDMQASTEPETDDLKNELDALKKRVATLEMLLNDVMHQLDTPSKQPKTKPKAKTKQPKQPKTKPKNEKLAAAILEVMRAEGAPMTREAIASELGIKKEDTGKAFAILFSSKQVKKEKKDGISYWKLQVSSTQA